MFVLGDLNDISSVVCLLPLNSSLSLFFLEKVSLNPCIHRLFVVITILLFDVKRNRKENRMKRKNKLENEAFRLL